MSFDPEEICTLCSSIRTYHTAVLPCDHKFCKQCIIDYTHDFIDHPNCPICQSRMDIFPKEESVMSYDQMKQIQAIADPYGDVYINGAYIYNRLLFKNIRLQKELEKAKALKGVTTVGNFSGAIKLHA